MDGEKTGWGRSQGRAVLERLITAVESQPGKRVFKLSMEGVERIDASFASEAVVELVRRYRGKKGICLVDLSDGEVRFNIEAAAERVEVPVMAWNGKKGEVIGSQPSAGNRGAFEFALSRPEARAAEFAEAMDGMSIANASTKFKQLWEQGFVLRNESAADSGGVEFLYQRIG
ncbi:MAG: DNA-binding protein [Pseudomonadota bacterium]